MRTAIKRLIGFNQASPSVSQVRFAEARTDTRRDRSVRQISEFSSAVIVALILDAVCVAPTVNCPIRPPSSWLVMWQWYMKG